MLLLHIWWVRDPWNRRLGIRAGPPPETSAVRNVRTAGARCGSPYSRYPFEIASPLQGVAYAARFMASRRSSPRQRVVRRPAAQSYGGWLPCPTSSYGRGIDQGCATPSRRCTGRLSAGILTRILGFYNLLRSTFPKLCTTGCVLENRMPEIRGPSPSR